MVVGLHFLKSMVIQNTSPLLRPVRDGLRMEDGRNGTDVFIVLTNFKIGNGIVD